MCVFVSLSLSLTLTSPPSLPHRLGEHIKKHNALHPNLHDTDVSKWRDDVSNNNALNGGINVKKGTALSRSSSVNGEISANSSVAYSYPGMPMCIYICMCV